MTTLYLNGRFVQAETATVPLGERGLLFGDGIYEVYRTYEGRPFRVKEHLDRLRRSAEAVAASNLARERSGTRSRSRNCAMTGRIR